MGGQGDRPIATTTRLVAVRDATLEVAMSDGGDSAPLVCAAHPADAFGAGTVALLARASGARVVCMNPRGLGGSSALADGQAYSIDDMASDLEAVRCALG